MSSNPPFLDPEDVSPEVAEVVLAQLNAFETPEEIAEAIEYPGEPDIGVRLGQRLLNAREQLGGFSDLQQVRAVRLIGPERFTEIVSALAGIPRPPSEIEQLRAELAALRASIAFGLIAATPGRRLNLAPVQSGSYLGQATTITATLMDGTRPAVDVPVTFVATRGVLRASDGYATHTGHLVTARTGVDGVIRLTALPTTTEEISPLQQDALSAILALLDPKAETPAETASGLRALAQQYAWEVNLSLRQAIDIYVREFRPMLLDTVNIHDDFFAWPYHDSAILAFAPAVGNGGHGSSVSATATLHLRARNWIPAFLASSVALSREESVLADELRDITAGETDGALLINNIYAHAGRYVGTRRGVVGAYVGRKVAEASIRTFLETELPNLPLDTRVAVFPALDIASKTIASTDSGVIRAIVGTRQDVTKEIDKRTGRDFGGITGVFDKLAGIEAAFALAPKATDLTNLRGELLNAVTAARTDLTNSLSTLQGQFAGALENIRVSFDDQVTVLESRLASTQLQLSNTVSRTEFNTALERKADRGALTDLQAQQAATSLQLSNTVSRTEFNTAIATKADRAALTTLQTDVSRVNTNLLDINRRLGR